MEVKDVSYLAPDHYRAKSMVGGGSVYNNSQAMRTANYKFAKAHDLRVNGFLDATRQQRYAGGQFQVMPVPKR